MLFVNHHSIWSQVFLEDESVLEEVRRVMTIWTFEKDKKYKNIVHKKPIKFYKDDSKYQVSIPTGLIDRLKNIQFSSVVIDDEIDDFTEEDATKVYNIMSAYDNMFEVRPHQTAATTKCMRLKRGIINIATGGGKTEVIASMCHLIKGKILIINSRTNILKQIDERLRLRGVVRKIEYLSSKTDFDKSEIVISTNNTAFNLIKKGNVKFLNYLKEIKGLIYDEAHHISANSQMLVALLSDPEYCLGFSGSPFKSKTEDCVDDLIAKSIFGSVIHYTSMKYLKAMGYSAKLSAYFIDYASKAMPYATRNCQRVYKWFITNNKSRNEVALSVLKMLDNLGLKTLVMVNQIDHGLMIMDMLKESGVNSVFFAGGETMFTNNNLEKDAKGKYIRKGQSGGVNEVKNCIKSGINLIIGSSVFNEGVDVSEFDVGMLLAAGKDAVSIIQRMGRVTRKKYKGLNECVFIDFNDSKHYIVENWVRTRKSQIAQEGVPILNNFDELTKLLNTISMSRKEV